MILDIGLQVRIVRTYKRLRQVDLASWAGVTQAQVSALERSEYVPLSIRRRVLQVLGLDEDELGMGRRFRLEGAESLRGASTAYRFFQCGYTVQNAFCLLSEQFLGTSTAMSSAELTGWRFTRGHGWVCPKHSAPFRSEPDQ